MLTARGSHEPSPDAEFFSLAPAEEDPAEELDGLRRRALELVRGEFEERTWKAFWQTEVEQRPAAEVAQELGMTPAAVHQARHRIKKKLVEALNALEASERKLIRQFPSLLE